MNVENPGQSSALESRPRLPWGVPAAFLIFLASLAMPAWEMDTYGPPPASAPRTPERLPGWECAQWSAIFFWDILRGGDDFRLESSFTIPNLLMLLVPGLSLIRPARRRFWPAVAASVALFHVLYWPVAKHGHGERVLIGYWFWLASFATLASALWLWEARVRRAEQSSPENR